MKIDTERMLHMQQKIIESRYDPLINFVIEPMMAELIQLQQQNLANLYTIANELDIRYIWIESREIAGCENISYNGWPAIWEVVKRLSISGGAGNSDQHQIVAGPWFTDIMYGAHDTLETRKLTKTETQSLTFKKVVSR